MEMERKGVECCWRGSTPAAEGFAQIFCVCIAGVHQRGSFVHELFAWVPFSARSFDTLSLASKVTYSTVRRAKVFRQTGSNIGLKLSELREWPSFRPVAYSISGFSVMLARNMFEDSSLKKFPPSQTSFKPCS